MTSLCRALWERLFLASVCGDLSVSESIHEVLIGCVNSQTLGNKATAPCLNIIDEQLDILAVTETWHEDSSSGYYCIDAANYVAYLTVVVSLSWIAGCQRLCSAHRRRLDVPRYRRATLGRLVLSVAGPAVWNSFPDELREETENTFWLSLIMSLCRHVSVLAH